MRLFLVGLLLLLVGPALGQTATAQQVLRAAVTEVIQPGMEAFEQEADALRAAMEALCQAPSIDALAKAKAAFGASAIAYARIEFLRIGPLMEDNRVDRLLFFPDRRGIGLRQVQAILTTQDATATELDSLRGKSVAAQGFGALDYMLSGTDSETLLDAKGAFRCAYGHAVAANVAQIASELAAGWTAPDGIAEHLMAPQPDYTDYRTETEALEALVGLLAHGVEAVRDTRINPFIANDERKARPKEAVLWRSGLTLAMIEANLNGMRQLLLQSGIARAVGEEHAGLENSVDFEFGNAARAVELVTMPVEEAVADEKQAFALSYLVIVTGSLQALIGEQLSAALGLSVGFSSLDGD